MSQLKTREQAQREAQREAEAERRDWKDALNNAATERVFTRLLLALGVNRLMVSKTDMRNRNLAEQILDRIADADPESYMRIMRRVHNI